MAERSVSRLPISESQYQSRIIDTALAYGWRIHHDRPSMDRRGRWSTAIEGHAGFPDLVLLRAGRLVVLEVKRQGQQPTPAQRVWLDAWMTVPGAEVLVTWPSNWSVVERMLR